MADQNVEEQNVDNDAVEPGKGGDIVDVVKDGQAAGDDGKRAQHAQAVRIVDFPATRVAAMEHRGDPRLLGETIARFIAWRKAQGLPPRLAATYNIAWTDPARTPPADYRMDLCVVTGRELPEDGSGMVAKTIPAGRCAVLRHIGSDDLLGLSAQRLIGDWLPASGEP